MSCEARTIPVTTLEPAAWVAGTDDPREYLRHPQQLGDHVAHVNGHVMLITPGQAPADGAEMPRDTRARFEDLASVALSDDIAWQPLDIPPPPDPAPCVACKGTGKGHADCRECDGDGELELDSYYNSYCVECKTCGGDGRDPDRGIDGTCSVCSGTLSAWRPSQQQEVLGVPVQWAYLSRLYGQPGISVARSSLEHMLIFRQDIDGQRVACGLIMGMRG